MGTRLLWAFVRWGPVGWRGVWVWLWSLVLLPFIALLEGWVRVLTAFDGAARRWASRGGAAERDEDLRADTRPVETRFGRRGGRGADGGDGGAA